MGILLQPGKEVMVDMPADDTCSGTVARGCKGEPTVFSPKKLSKKECAATPGRLKGKRPFPRVGKRDDLIMIIIPPIEKRPASRSMTPRFQIWRLRSHSMNHNK